MKTSGYSGTPLAIKLGLKEDYKIILYNQPEYYFELFTDLPASFEILEIFKPQSADFIHLFVVWSKELTTIFNEYKESIKKEGMIWISWPKGISKTQTDLNRDAIRKYVLSNGLVDVKVAAIDEDWSGLKFVYRIKDRN